MMRVNIEKLSEAREKKEDSFCLFPDSLKKNLGIRPLRPGILLLITAFLGVSWTLAAWADPVLYTPVEETDQGSGVSSFEMEQQIQMDESYRQFLQAREESVSISVPVETVVRDPQAQEQVSAEILAASIVEPGEQGPGSPLPDEQVLILEQMGKIAERNQILDQLRSLYSVQADRSQTAAGRQYNLGMAAEMDRRKGLPLDQRLSEDRAQLQSLMNAHGANLLTYLVDRVRYWSGEVRRLSGPAFSAEEADNARIQQLNFVHRLALAMDPSLRN